MITKLECTFAFLRTVTDMYVKDGENMHVKEEKEVRKGVRNACGVS